MLDGVFYNAKKTALTLTTDFTEDKFDLSDFESTVKNVNASALKTGIKTIGNTKDNSIVGGDGNNIIYGFDNKDPLNAGSFDFTATYKNKAVTLIFDEGSVTFKDFTAKTFHINYDTYKISRSKFVKKF